MRLGAFVTTFSGDEGGIACLTSGGPLLLQRSPWVGCVVQPRSPGVGCVVQPRSPGVCCVVQP